MATKHVVTDGIGFTVPSYLLTEGIGDFEESGAPATGDAEDDRRRTSVMLKIRLKRY